MKGHEIEIGGTYLAKVSGQLQRVRVTGRGTRYLTGRNGQPDTERTTWRATNLRTGRTIVIRSAQRLRQIHDDKPRIALCAECRASIGGAAAGPDAAYRSTREGEACQAADCVAREAHA